MGVLPLTGYYSVSQASQTLRISKQQVYRLLRKGTIPVGRDGKKPLCISEADIDAYRSRPKCGCCADINSAIKAHANVVEWALTKLGIFPGSVSSNHYSDYESAYSDALQALWQALLSVDARMKTEQYLYVKVRQRVIDGLRRRGVDKRRSEEVKRLKLLVVAPDRLPANFDVPTSPEWSEANDDDRPQKLMALAEHLDPMLPGILNDLAQGYLQVEIAEDLGISISAFNRKLAAIRAYAEMFPDLVWRPEYSWVNRTWRTR